MHIVGIDEVGRGCWAGPLVAGAVVLPDGFVAPHDISWKLADSKVMKKLERSTADTEIRRVAAAFGLGWVSAGEVDSFGLTEAVRLAMRRALAGITDTVSHDEIIIDGNFNYLADNPKARAMVKADASVPAVSAASIIAKVARDAWMADQVTRFPGYGFESHVGYGTKQHLDALRKYGPCELHRRSYKPVRVLDH